MPIRSSVYLFSVLLFLTFALGFLTGNFYPKKLFAPPLTVVRVIDGDTVELSDQRHLRLRGINAPELNKHECLAAAAKDRLSHLLLNQAITIEATTAVVDNFGRTVAVINFEAAQDAASVRGAMPSSEGGILERSGLPSLSSVISHLFGRGKPEPLSTTQQPREVAVPPIGGMTSSNGSPQSLNTLSTDPAQVLVREGLARSAGPFPSEAYQEKLFTLEETAKDAGRGLWNPEACPTPTPVPAYCNIKGNIHWKKRQKLYFPPDCTGYARVTIEPKNGDRWFCSASEAEESGFTLASTCLPR